MDKIVINTLIKGLTISQCPLNETPSRNIFRFITFGMIVRFIVEIYTFSVDNRGNVGVDSCWSSDQRWWFF